MLDRRTQLSSLPVFFRLNRLVAWLGKQHQLLLKNQQAAEPKPRLDCRLLPPDCPREAQLGDSLLPSGGRGCRATSRCCSDVAQQLRPLLLPTTALLMATHPLHSKVFPAPSSSGAVGFGYNQALAF